jgi:hypothetical protein
MLTSDTGWAGVLLDTYIRRGVWAGFPDTWYQSYGVRHWQSVCVTTVHVAFSWITTGCASWRPQEQPCSAVWASTTQKLAEGVWHSWFSWLVRWGGVDCPAAHMSMGQIWGIRGYRDSDRTETMSVVYGGYKDV